MNRLRLFRAGFVSLLVCSIGLTSAPPALATSGSTWCPLLLTAYGDPTCTPLSSSLQTTVNEAKADGRPGNIYALGGTNFNENVVADKLKGVIFQGGVAGGVTTILGSMTISNSSMIAFNSFTVTGGITLLNAKGAHQLYGNSAAVSVQGGKFTSGTISDGASTWILINALRIYNHVGNVTLTKVTASKAASNGAVIGSVDGSAISVNQSKFTGNDQAGLVVSGGSGPITLTDVSATRNSVYGAYLQTTGAVPVIVTTDKTRLNHFDKNGYCGLQASGAGTGSVQVIDVTANKNGQCGASLFATSGSIVVTTVKSRGNHFDKNGVNGLTVTTDGLIGVADVSASKNGGYGASLDNGGGTSAVILTVFHAKHNAFDKNTDFGLSIASQGFVGANNISASRNTLFGAIIDNSGSGKAMTLGSTKGRNTFDRNGGYGLIMQSGLTLSATDISASRNGQFGAFLFGNSGAVSLSASASKLNSFDRNSQFGLYVNSGNGQILVDVSASKNGQFGAYISNGGVSAVVIQTSKSKQNQFSNNGQNGLIGGSTAGFDIHNTTASKNGPGGTFDGFNLTTTNSSATLTCSTAKSNTGNGIIAGLGTGTLFLKSTVPTGNGTNINLVTGLGPTISTVGCPS